MRYLDLQTPLAVPAPVQESQQVEVEEAYRGRGGWVILPATMALYNKKVVDIVTAASTWADHEDTILVCTKDEGGRKRVLFISSYGDRFNDYTIGQTEECFHDQTGASKGMYTVMNVVVLKGGEILKKKNEFGLNVKASLAVFK